MRLLLAAVGGAWVALAFIATDPHTASPGATALAQVLGFVLVILVIVFIIGKVRHDGNDHRSYRNSGRQ